MTSRIKAPAQKAPPRLIAAQLVQKLKHPHRWVGTVESCTGGLVSHLITNIPGSSEVFLSSWITYSNLAKIQLGVSPQILTQFGAVSPEIAGALAESGLAALSKLAPNTPVACVSTTGIAGPDGGSPSKPVGLCYIAVAQNDQPTQIHRVEIPSDLGRRKIKFQFARKALKFLEEALSTSA